MSMSIPKINSTNSEEFADLEPTNDDLEKTIVVESTVENPNLPQAEQQPESKGSKNF